MIDVLADLLARLIAIVPRFSHIERGCQGLLSKRGVYRALDPGFHLYWPFWTTVQAYPVNRQAMSVEVVRDEAGRPICTQLWLVYEIYDLVLAAETSADWADTIDDVARITVIMDEGDLREQIAEQLKEYGIFITDFACVEYTPRVFRLEHVGSHALEA